MAPPPQGAPSQAGQTEVEIEKLQRNMPSATVRWVTSVVEAQTAWERSEHFTEATTWEPGLEGRISASLGREGGHPRQQRSES